MSDQDEDQAPPEDDPPHTFWGWLMDQLLRPVREKWEDSVW